MANKYSTKSLASRGKPPKGDDPFKTVNVSFAYDLYCRLKVVSTNTGKPMKQLLIESFIQVYGPPTEEDINIIRGVTPAPLHGSIRPIGDKKVIYDPFTGLPLDQLAEKIEKKKDPVPTTNPVADKLFRRQK